MATKILNTNGALGAGDANVEFGTGFTPKAGLTWVAVELRPYFTGAGDCFLYVDDQQYIQVASEDVSTFGRPHVIAIQVQQPVLLHLKFTDRSGAANAVGADLTVEETSTTGAGV